MARIASYPEDFGTRNPRHLSPWLSRCRLALLLPFYVATFLATHAADQPDSDLDSQRRQIRAVADACIMLPSVLVESGTPFHAAAESVAKAQMISPAELKQSLADFAGASQAAPFDRALADFARQDFDAAAEAAGQASEAAHAQPGSDGARELERDALVLRGEAFFARNRFTDARQAFDAAIAVTDRMALPKSWAGLQYRRAVAIHGMLSQAAPADAQSLQAQAADALRAALEIYRPGEFPQERAEAQYRLGIVLGLHAEALGGDVRALRFGEAGDALRGALEFFAKSDSPYVTTDCLARLGIARWNQSKTAGAPERDRMLAEAVAADREALQSLDRKLQARSAVRVLTNLAAALLDQACAAGKSERMQRLEDVESTCREALHLLPADSNSPLQALIQLNLGQARMNRAALASGEVRVRLLKETVASNRAALEFLTADTDPQNWAVAESSLGLAAMDLGLATTGADRAAYFDAAATAFHALLEKAPPGATEAMSRGGDVRWAQAQKGLAFVLWSRAKESGGAERIRFSREAAAELRLSLKFYPREAQPEQWAQIQDRLGLVLHYAAGDSTLAAPERIQRHDEAAEAYRAALQIYTRDAQPQNWAGALTGHALVLRDKAGVAAEPERSRCLQDAESMIRESLEVFTRSAQPEDWATAQNHLGEVLLEEANVAGSSEKAQLLEKAAAAFRSAMEVNTQKGSPDKWAQAQLQIGMVLWAQAGSATEDQRLQLLRNSADAIRGSVEIFSKEESAAFYAANSDWVKSVAIEVQDELALELYVAVKASSGKERIQLSKEAVQALRDALKSCSRETSPEQWAQIQLRLGDVLRYQADDISLGTYNRSLLCDEAVSAYREASQIYTRDAAPEMWARCQQNVGLAFLGKALTGYLDPEVEDSFSLALTAFPREKYPAEWAAVKYNFADAVMEWAKIRPERARDLGGQRLKAIVTSFRAALEVYTREAYPEEWANAQYKLGIALWNEVLAVPEPERAQMERDALAAVRNSMEVFTEQKDPMSYSAVVRWLRGAEAEHGRYLFFQAIPPRGAESRQLSHEAEISLRSAISYITPGTAASESVQLYRRLGEILRLQGGDTSLPDSERLQRYGEAEKACRAAVSIGNPDADPKNWVPAQNDLALTLVVRAGVLDGAERTSLLQEAADDIRAALEVLIKNVQSTERALAEDYLGNVLEEHSKTSFRDGITEQLLIGVQSTCVQALKLIPADSNPPLKALLQLNLGQARMCAAPLTSGEQRLRLSRDATDELSAAVKFYTRDTQPGQWAQIQYGLGLVLRYVVDDSTLAAPERVQRYDEAAEAYRAALQIYTRDAQPQNWAWTLTGHALVLRDKAGVSTGPERSKCLQDAESMIRESLEVFTRDAQPENWATAQNRLGEVLWERAKVAASGEKAPLLEKSAAAFRSAMEVTTREASPDKWAQAQFQIGMVLWAQARIAAGAQRLQFLQNSADAIGGSLEIFKKERRAGFYSANAGWIKSVAAEVQDELASQMSAGANASSGAQQASPGAPQDDVASQLYVKAKAASGAERIRLSQEAEQALRGALKSRSRESSPEQWAQIQLRLGDVLRYQSEDTSLKGNERSRLSDEAVSAYRAAMQIYTRDADPQTWAWCQISIGQAILGEVVSARGPNPGQRGIAIRPTGIEACYSAALTVFTREKYPAEWAAVKDNLADALMEAANVRPQHPFMIPMDRQAQLLKDAVAACRAPLEVYTREANPNEWAKAQYKLGMSLWSAVFTFPNPERAKAEQDAITAVRNSMEIVTAQKDPVSYAASVKWMKAAEAECSSLLCNRAMAYRGAERTQQLHEAEVLVRSAISFLTPDSDAREAVELQCRLAQVLQSQSADTSLSASDRIQRYGEAEEAYRAALQSVNRDADPKNWASAQNGLALTLQDKARLFDGAERTTLLQEAATDIRAVLEFLGNKGKPVECGLAEDQLSNVLQEQAKTSIGAAKAQLLEEAATAVRAALQFHSGVNWVDFGMEQDRLATVLWAQANAATGAQRLAFLDKAVTAVRKALEECAEQSRHSQGGQKREEAEYQSHLGGMLLAETNELGGAERNRLACEAETALKAALKYYAREKYPGDWGDLQNKLGRTFWVQAESATAAQRLQLMQDAMAAVRSSLEVQTEKQAPDSYTADAEWLKNAEARLAEEMKTAGPPPDRTK